MTFCGAGDSNNDTGDPSCDGDQHWDKPHLHGDCALPHQAEQRVQTRLHRGHHDRSLQLDDCPRPPPLGNAHRLSGRAVQAAGG